MSLFAIADLHLSFGTNKPMNIFRGWDGYEEQIDAAWQRLVSPEDTVVIAGDISWAMDFSQLAADFDFIDRLPGKKLILKGNHDYWWNSKTKMDRFCAENGYSTIGFIHNNTCRCGQYAVCGTRGWFYDLKENDDKKVLLREAGRLETSIAAAEKTGLEPLVFLHYPPLYGDYRCDEIMDVLLRHRIRRCYYGHLHAQSHAKAVNGEAEGIVFTNIAADWLRFTPLEITQEENVCAEKTEK